MSRDPIVSSNDDAESALSDDELDVVVGGRHLHRPPFDQGLYVHVSPRYNAAAAHPPAGLGR
jgi:hypothetical protein